MQNLSGSDGILEKVKRGIVVALLFWLGGLTKSGPAEICSDDINTVIDECENLRSSTLRIDEPDNDWIAGAVETELQSILEPTQIYFGYKEPRSIYFDYKNKPQLTEEQAKLAAKLVDDILNRKWTYNDVLESLRTRYSDAAHHIIASSPSWSLYLDQKCSAFCGLAQLHDLCREANCQCSCHSPWFDQKLDWKLPDYDRI